MRQSLIVLCCAAAGVLGGGALIGLWALGVCLIFVSLCAGVWALSRDDGTGAVPQVHHVPTTLQAVLDRAARAS